MQTHPKWKYHPKEQAVIVADKEAEEALGLGWFDTPAEALASVEDEGDDSEEHRKELLAEAKELGLNLHHRSGISTIQSAIDAHNTDENA
jgi:hypothetical protein